MEIDPYDAKEDANKILKEFKSIADKLEIKFFLCFGTVLGFIREKGFIKGDNDIDIGLICEGKEFEGFGGELMLNGFWYRTGSCGRLFLKKGILLDVFLLHPEKISKIIKGFNSIKYDNEVYSIPHPIEDFLKEWYGDWKTPKETTVNYKRFFGGALNESHYSL